MATITRTISQGSDDAKLFSNPGGNTLTIGENSVISATGLTDETCGLLRFNNITIPAGSTINSAYLKVTSYNSHTYDMDYKGIRIKGINNSNVATFSNGSTSYPSFVTSTVLWATGKTITANTEYTSNDIKTIIQDIINISGWSSGNSLCISIIPEGEYYGYTFDIYSYEGDTSKVAELEITYTTNPSTITNVTSIKNLTSIVV